jgi:hypothetical protein
MHMKTSSILTDVLSAGMTVADAQQTVDEYQDMI